METLCIPCNKRNVKCDGIQPTCGECTNANLNCRYDTAALAERIRDPLQLRDIEGRLKKMELQLARAVGSKQFKRPQTEEQQSRQQQQLHGQTRTASIQQRPAFSIGKKGLCIETDISEAHHLLKALFSTVDTNKIKERAHKVFNPASLPTSNENLHELPRHDIDDGLLDRLLKSDDPIEDSWIDMVISSRYHRCFGLYQMVGQKISSCATAYLRDLAMNKRTEVLFFALSLRAFVYQHENDFHQDSEYPVQTSKGYQYMECAKLILEACYTTSSPITIRALLHLFSFYIHRSPYEAFQYGDLAIRMAQDLRLHKTEHSNEDARRLWWAAYWCNLFAAVHYHRPLLVLDEDIEVDFPRKSEDEPTDVGYRIDYCVMTIKMLRIRRSMVGVLRTPCDPKLLLQRVKDLEVQIGEWQSELPPHARVDVDFYGQDTFSIELGMALNIELQHVKIQLYQCLVDNAEPLSLIATRNYNKAFENMADMLVRHGDKLHMCTCKAIAPIIRQIIELDVWRRSTQGIDIKDSLKKLQGALNCHAFLYLDDTKFLVSLIEDILADHTHLPVITNSLSLKAGDTSTIKDDISIPGANNRNIPLTPLESIAKQTEEQSPVISAGNSGYLTQFPIIPPSFATAISTEQSFGNEPQVAKHRQSGATNITRYNSNSDVSHSVHDGQGYARSTQEEWAPNADCRLTNDGVLSTKLFDTATSATEMTMSALLYGPKPTFVAPRPANDTNIQQTDINCYSVSRLEEVHPISNNLQEGANYHNLENKVAQQETVVFTPYVGNEQFAESAGSQQWSIAPGARCTGLQPSNSVESGWLEIDGEGRSGSVWPRSLRNTPASSQQWSQISHSRLPPTPLDAARERAVTPFDAFPLADWQSVAWHTTPDRPQSAEQQHHHH